MCTFAHHPCTIVELHSIDENVYQNVKADKKTQHLGFVSVYNYIVCTFKV